MTWQKYKLNLQKFVKKNIHRLSGIYRQAKEFFDKFSI